jgi:hypothetical protein
MNPSTSATTPTTRFPLFRCTAGAVLALLLMDGLIFHGGANFIGHSIWRCVCALAFFGQRHTEATCWLFGLPLLVSFCCVVKTGGSTAAALVGTLVALAIFTACISGCDSPGLGVVLFVFVGPLAAISAWAACEELLHE